VLIDVGRREEEEEEDAGHSKKGIAKND